MLHYRNTASGFKCDSIKCIIYFCKTSNFLGDMPCYDFCIFIRKELPVFFSAFKKLTYNQLFLDMKFSIKFGSRKKKCVE